MSVNTPKRPKTTYYPGICSESPVFGDGQSPTALQWHTDMAWPIATANMDSPLLPASSSASRILTSPSSSSCCGSPEIIPNGSAVLRTPSSSNIDLQGRDAVQFPTPTTTTATAPLTEAQSHSGGREHHKRGRPRSETLTNLMLEGSTSPSAIKCKYCYRVFPREKSLAAHLRTHTGERPYVCDYPGCTKSFTQSGQMKTHQRLHTGERPFICPVASCEMRFTHANRHCPVHVNAVLKRDDKFVVKMTPEQNEEVLLWLQKYRAEREDKSTPTRKTPQRSRSSSTPKGRSASAGSGTAATTDSSAVEVVQEKATTAGTDDDTVSSSTSGSVKRHPPNNENECPVTPTTPSKNAPYKSRKGLMVELDMNAGLAMSPLAPLKMKPQPKVIQWQEPLSQGEEDEDEEEEVGERTTGAAKYYLNENYTSSRQKQQTQSPKRLKEKENRNYSPSKKAAATSFNKSSSTFNPKKKWLREACMEDLAKPLEPSGSLGAAGEGNGLVGSPRKLQIKSMNLLRPTVLMLASKDKQIPLSSSSDVPRATVLPSSGGGMTTAPTAVDGNRRWLGKMALMQLAPVQDEGRQVGGESSEGASQAQVGMVNGLGVGVRGATVGVSSTSGLLDAPEYTQL